MGNFRGISLKKELVDEAENVVKETGQYKSVAELVSEAVRLRLADLRKTFKEA